MGEMSEFATQGHPQDHVLPQSEPTTAQQDQDNGDSAQSKHGVTHHMEQEAHPATPLPLQDGNTMTASLGSSDTPNKGVGEASPAQERGGTEVKRLTIALKLPGDKLATLASSDAMKTSFRTSEEVQPASVNADFDPSAAHPTPKPDVYQEGPQIKADVETLGHEMTSDIGNDGSEIEHIADRDEIMSELPLNDPSQPKFRAGSTEDQHMEDERSVTGEAQNTTAGEIKQEQDQEQEIQTSAQISPADVASDTFMVFSSSLPERAGEQPKAVDKRDDTVESDRHINDEERIVIEASGTNKHVLKKQDDEEPQGQVSKEEHQNIQNTQSDGMIMALLQHSQAAVMSAQDPRQEVMQHKDSHPASQQPSSPRSQFPTTDPEIQRQIKQLEFQAQQRKEALAAARAQTQATSGTLGQGQLDMNSALPRLPPMGLPQQMGGYYGNLSYMAQGYPGPPLSAYGYSNYGQVPHGLAQTQYPQSGSAYQGSPGLLSVTNGAMGNGHYRQAFQASQLQLQRNASLAEIQRQQAESRMPDSDSDPEDLPLTSKPCSQPSSGYQGTAQDDNTIAVIPKTIPPSSPPSEIDFTLPRYEIQRLPVEGKDDNPIAKVSLPGLVREELLLSPDHADQELHLLLNIFLPGQQRLETPDSEPAAAVLNFHNIALMIIEAYVQFEIGDEFGTGRGHWHNDHDEDGEGEYRRLRDAKDANPDDIFFAVIDRWHAGIESGRKGFQLIRGAQEFCDVALDVIYYVKNHGLLAPQKPKGGKGEGKAKGKVGEDGDGERGKKRGAQKVMEVQPRKKAKTTPAKGKGKGKLAVSKAVTVVKRGR